MSFPLAREVQVLLLNMGIVSSLLPKYNREYDKHSYIVAVLGTRSLALFHRLIGFESERKQTRLECVVRAQAERPRNKSCTESIPHQRDWCARLLESVPKVKPCPGVKQAWGRSALRDFLGNTIKPSSKEQMTYPRLEKTLAEARRLGADPEVIEHFQELFDLDYFFDPVVEVEGGETLTYDLNVPEGAMFVANGMTNHNTTLSACIAAYESYKLIKKGHPQGYFGLPDQNIIQIISVATDKDQAGLLYREVHGHFTNCFAADTEIITADGIQPIGSLAGTTQTLLAGNGVWVEAPIRSFGTQRLYKLTLSRDGIEKVVHTTADHRWFARDARNQNQNQGFVEFKTTELQPGKHQLQQVYERGCKNKVQHWTVKAVEPTDRVEEVFCASVPDVRSFTLGGNIVTGNCDYFAAYMANATQTFATFQTPRDIERFGSYADNNKARFSVKVTFRSCVAKGLRGAGNIVVILDEMAHFTDKGQSGAKAVYDAITPSTSAFSPKDPNDTLEPIGPVEGRIVCISSPLGKQGQFYKLFQIGMEGGDAAEDMLCIEAPTWEINPTIPKSEFAKHYRKDANVFFTEYGGQFTDRRRGWIEDEKDLHACIDPDLRPKKRAAPRAPHFMGIDIALVNDYSALAIGHLDTKGNVVLDLAERIRAGEGDYVGMDRLEFDDVADWIYKLSRRFYISKGMFDRWAGIPLEQALAKKGLKQMEAVHHTQSLKSQIFQNFKDMMYDRRVVLYDWPIPDETGVDHCDYIEELCSLQAEVLSKYVILVEAPNIDGKYDDYSDAIVRMVWLATNHIGNRIAFGHNGNPKNASGKMMSPVSAARARVKARLGGSHTSRMPGLARGGRVFGGGGSGGSRGGRGGGGRW